MYILEAWCALAVALLFSDVKAQTKLEFSLPSYPVRDYEILIFRVRCTSKCTILKIIVDEYEGSLQMNAVGASGKFCLHQTKECPSKQLDEKIFYITLRPKPKFEGGKLTVLLGQKGVIDELDADCASTFGETGGHDGKYVRIKSGSFTTKFPNYPRLYEIQCDGNCRDIDIQSRTKEKVKLVAAEEPVFLTDGGCYNCFCESNRNQGYFQQCVEGRKKKFSLQKSSIYVTMLPDKEIKGVRAIVKGDNIESIKEYVRDPYGWPVYDTKDGYRAGVFRFARAPIGSQTLLVVRSAGLNRCDDVKIEVFADSTVLTLNVGHIYWLGGCYICSCTDVASCKRRHMPRQVKSNKGYFYFGIYIRLDKSQKTIPGYIKISGKHIREVNFKYEYNL